MDTVLFGFRNPDLERQFDRYALHGQLWAVDPYCLVLRMASVSFAAVVWYRNDRLGWVPFVAAVGHVLASLTALILRRRLGIRGMEKWRTKIILGTRFTRTICNGVFEPYAPCELFKLPPKPWLAALRGFSANELGTSLTTGLGLRLKLRYHLMHAIPELFLYLFCKGHIFCECAMDTEGAEAFLNLEKQMGHVADTIGLVIHAPFMNFKPKKKTPCLQLSMFIHLYFGIVLVSYVIWAMEQRLRVQFIRSLQSRREDHGFVLPEMENLSYISWSGHLCYLLILYALTWEYFAWLPGMVLEYGFNVGLPHNPEQMCPIT